MRAALAACVIAAGWQLGCCTTRMVPIESTWYVLPTPTATPPSSRNEPARIGLALLNETRETLDVTAVHVNGKPVSLPDASTSFALKPGRFVILPLRQVGTDGSGGLECDLPVSVRLLLETNSLKRVRKAYGRKAVDKEGWVSAQLTGRMPSALPTQWERCGTSAGQIQVSVSLSDSK